SFGVWCAPLPSGCLRRRRSVPGLRSREPLEGTQGITRRRHRWRIAEHGPVLPEHEQLSVWTAPQDQGPVVDEPMMHRTDQDEVGRIGRAIIGLPLEHMMNL